MFEWLRRRRKYTAAVVCHAREVGQMRSMLEDLVRDSPTEITILPTEFMSEGYNAPIIRHLDNEDHITCIKCGHTHIVRRD